MRTYETEKLRMRVLEHLSRVEEALRGPGHWNALANLEPGAGALHELVVEDPEYRATYRDAILRRLEALDTQRGSRSLSCGEKRFADHDVSKIIEFLEDQLYWLDAVERILEPEDPPGS